MKKVIIYILMLCLSIPLMAQKDKKTSKGIGNEVREMAKEASEKKGIGGEVREIAKERNEENKEIKNTKKYRTITGKIIKIDEEAKTFTVESVKKKGEVMSFTYLDFKEIDISKLKLGETVKIKYEGTENPQIKKFMLIEKPVKKAKINGRGNNK